MDVIPSRELYCAYGKLPQKLTSLLSSLSHTPTSTGLSSTYGAMLTKPTGWGGLKEPQQKTWQRHWLQHGLVLQATVLKSQLSISLVMEQFLKVAKSVMFSALKIEQKFPQKHTIMDD